MPKGQRVDIVMILVLSIAVVEEASNTAALPWMSATNDYHLNRSMYPSAISIYHQHQSVELAHSVYA